MKSSNVLFLMLAAAPWALAAACGSGGGPADGQAEEDVVDDGEDGPEPLGCEPVCGDGICMSGEDCASCPEDCDGCSPTARTYYVAQADPLCSDDVNDGGSGAPWCTVQKALATATSGDTVMLMDGDYGELSDSLTADRTNWLTFRAAPGQRPVFDRISVSGSDNDAYLRFDGIEVLLPADPECQYNGSEPAIVSIRGANHVAFVNSEIHATHMLQASGGIRFAAEDDAVPHDLLVDSCDVHDAGSGIRFSGSDIVISRSHIHRAISTTIGCMAGMGAWNVTIDCNRIHDMDDRPEETCYEEGSWSEVHASSISVRGHDFQITRNHIYDTRLGIQLYEDDAGGTYDLSNIVLEYNLIYDIHHPYSFYNPGAIDGPVVMRHNTFIGIEREDPSSTSDPLLYRFDQSLSIGLTDNPAYTGAGTIVRDNIILEYFSISEEAYTSQPWEADFNLIYAPAWNQGSLDPSNLIVVDSTKAGDIPDGFIDNDLFIDPYYASNPDERTCSPGGPCDFSPRAGSLACTMSSTGDYVGAIPCPDAP